MARSGRAVPRFSLRFPCQVVRERDFRLVGHLFSDVSERGLRIEAAAPCLTGERVLVSFRAPFSNEWIDTDGIVARVVHGRRPGDLRRGYGVAFTSMAPAARRLLGEGLRGLPLARTCDPRPPRPPG